jgi:hypothetical protein
MIARYRLVLNVPDRRYGCRRPVSLGAFRTVERALRRAERVLARHPSVETRWLSERWPFDCSLYDAKGPTLPNGRGVLVRLTDAEQSRLDAPIVLVPSVGELGWTP